MVGIVEVILYICLYIKEQEGYIGLRTKYTWHFEYYHNFVSAQYISDNTISGRLGI